MKSIMLLGGSNAQVPAIEMASQLGLRTVLCDYLPDNPGRTLADSYYPVSTTDKEAILQVARDEEVAGIVAYGSDPAAPTAAYVARELGLLGNPYGSVAMLCDKAAFRTFLESNGFNSPRFFKIGSNFPLDQIRVAAKKLLGPLVVKPVDSSGSKGVSVVESSDGLRDAVASALPHSRKGEVIVEEFVRVGPCGIVEAEIFVVDGVVSSWVLMQSIRDQGSNPLVPSLSIHPPRIAKSVENKIRQEIQKLVVRSGIRNGPMNIEMAIDCEERVFFLDVGPRNGGNMLVRFVSLVSGKDIAKATLLAAMEGVEFHDVEYDGNPSSRWVQHILGSARQGRFLGFREDYLSCPYLVENHQLSKRGDVIPAFEDASGALGISFLKFPLHFTDEEIADFVKNPCVVDADGEGADDFSAESFEKGI